MARTFPFLPEPFGFDPPLSILETLGVDDPAATVPADGLGLAEAIVSAAPSDAEFEAGNSTAPSPFGGLDVADATAPDLMAGLVTFGFDSAAEAAGSSPALQPAADASFLDDEGTADAGAGAPGGQPGAAAEGAAVDAGAAARGGPGGGGGGGGGGGTGVPPDYFSGSADSTAGYDIQIKFKGTGWTTDLREAFEHAADYLTTVITADIGGGGRIGKVTVDDLYVTAEVKAIDGVGGILGQAGPQYIWTSNDLTASGQMQFDVADASNYQSLGLWDDIVTHELMHVLGFGSLWDYGRHTSLVSGNQYTGKEALKAYQATHAGATFIPVEDDGGAGTVGAHWDEGALDNELMTGFIDGDTNPATINDNYLSKFSVMSLADLGYTVSYQDYSYDGVIG